MSEQGDEPTGGLRDPHALLEHDDFLRALARSLVADAARADDVVQQAYVAALARPTGARGDSGTPRSPRAWLARVVRNVAWKLRRSERRRTAHEQVTARAHVGGRTTPLRVEGEEAVAVVAAGKYLVRAVGRGCAPSFAEVVAREGEASEFELEFTPGCDVVLVLSGLDQLVAALGRCTPDVYARVVDPTERVLAERGLPTFGGRACEWRVALAPGRYRVEAVDGADVLGSAPIEVDARSAERDLELAFR